MYLRQQNVLLLQNKGPIGSLLSRYSTNQRQCCSYLCSIKYVHVALVSNEQLAVACINLSASVLYT